MVLATIMLGGATRLTDSGLSITEWQPLIGTIPPMDEAAWQDAFSRYQAIPEYELVNKGMSLSDFKIIYWWEWTHRFLARALGAVFLLPFLAFWFSRRLPRPLIAWLAVVFLLGALQGALGWYMVKSGLIARVDVSPYRLAAHLTLASFLLTSIIWIVVGLASPERRIRDAHGMRALLLVSLILLQIVFGGFMAGIDAGLATASWPDMDGKLIPEGLLALSPWWRNLFENALTVQFNHRMAAYFLVVFTAVHLILVLRREAALSTIVSGVGLLVVVILQVSLGVATLMTAVPLHLALMHQAGALLLLAAAVLHLHVLTADPKGRVAKTRLLRDWKFR